MTRLKPGGNTRRGHGEADGGHVGEIRLIDFAEIDGGDLPGGDDVQRAVDREGNPRVSAKLLPVPVGIRPRIESW